MLSRNCPAERAIQLLFERFLDVGRRQQPKALRFQSGCRAMHCLLVTDGQLHSQALSGFFHVSPLDSDAV